MLGDMPKRHSIGGMGTNIGEKPETGKSAELSGNRGGEGVRTIIRVTS
jgi:hypothetical protein